MSASKNKILEESIYNKHAEDWEDSGVSQKQYCKAHNISYAQFLVARARLNNPQDKHSSSPSLNGFSELVTKEESTPNQTSLGEGITLHLPSGIFIKFPNDCCPSGVVPWLDAISSTL